MEDQVSSSSEKVPTQFSRKKYGFFWITLILFSGSLIGHWFFGYVTSRIMAKKLEGYI